MNLISDLLKDIPLPRVVPIVQHFSTTQLADPVQSLREAIAASPATACIRPGMRIAISAGSRGIDRYVDMLRTIVEEVRSRGAEPVVVPAMGSHGGCTAQGQVKLLEGLGVTETSIGCPIQSSMETVELAKLDNGMPVKIDAIAHAADGIIVFNRIKPHTSFRSTHESGLAKMLVIGYGNQSGADCCHAWGFEHMGQFIYEMAMVKLEKCKVIMGVGTIENAFDKIVKVVVCTAQDLLRCDAEAQAFAKTTMPRLLISPLDVLVVGQAGKEYSGSGMDPNIVGVSSGGVRMSDTVIKAIALLDLSERSHGNATGMGMASLITRRYFEKIDFATTYANVLTAAVAGSGRTPMTLDSDNECIRAALRVSTPKSLEGVRLMYIANTLHLKEAYISEALLEEAQKEVNIMLAGKARAMSFDSQGTLTLPWGFASAH